MSPLVLSFALIWETMIATIKEQHCSIQLFSAGWISKPQRQGTLVIGMIH